MTPNDYSRHPHYEHDAMEAAKAVIAPLRAKVVRRSADKIVEAQIKTLLANRMRNIEAPESEEKMGLLIIGDSGAGKTKLVENRVQNDPLVTSMTSGNPFGYVSVKFRSPVRIPTAGLSVVRKLGLPGAQLNDRKNHWDEVILRTGALDTCILHLDEVQDAFRQNKAIAHTWLQTFKALMTSDRPVVLVATGTPELLPYFRREDAQTARRMVELILPALGYPRDQKSLESQMDAYCEMAGMTNDLAGSDYERLMRASAYAFGRTLRLGLNGILEAKLAGSSGLKRVHLAHAFERDRPSTPPAQNFFWADDYLHLSPFGAGYGDGLPPKSTRPSVPREKTKW